MDHGFTLYTALQIKLIVLIVSSCFTTLSINTIVSPNET